MLSIERVFNRLQGKPADRIPFALTTSLYGARLTSCPLNIYYTDPGSYMNGQMAIADELRQDILFTPFALILEAESFGSIAVSFEKNPPNLKVPAISRVEEIADLRLPELYRHKGLSYILESTALMAEQFKNEIPVAAICTSPTDLPALIMGIENWIDTLLFHPVEARKLLDLTGAFFISYANELLSKGASCIVATAVFTNASIITHKIASNILIPVFHECFPKINGPVIIHHGGARLVPFLGLLDNLPNVAGYAIGSNDRFIDAREIIGKEPVLMGNLNGQLLLNSSPKSIEEWCINILEERSEDSKFILGTSNADIPYDTDIENLKIIGKTVRNFYR